MTFGPDHYVPVLKVKGGEKRALQRISPILQSRMTPLLEIVERKTSNTQNAHLVTAFKNLAETVRPYSRCFLDAREIAADGPAGAADVFQRASDAGIVFTPVTGISRRADVVPALAHRENGLALRLTRSEFEQGELAIRINVFLTEHSLTPEQLDLIIDLGAVEDFIIEGIEALTDAFVAEVPNHQRWNTFTISACSFPKSMGGVNRNSHALVERGEWLAWKSHLYDQRQNLPRLPTFSDCVIQHPAGVEGFDPRIMAASAAVRYTLEGEWLLIKGRSTKAIRAGEQFPDLAHELVYGSFRSRFYGSDHCNGCQLMKAAADGAPSLGSAGVWRQMGTIHHLSVVTQALASLPWP
jgi:hypothetical protein